MGIHGVTFGSVGFRLCVFGVLGHQIVGGTMAVTPNVSVAAPWCLWRAADTKDVDAQKVSAPYGDFHKGGTPKWMVYMGKSYKNGWFRGTPIYGTPHMIAFFWQHPTRNLGCVLDRWILRSHDIRWMRHDGSIQHPKTNKYSLEAKLAPFSLVRYLNMFLLSKAHEESIHVHRPSSVAISGT